MSKTFTCDDCEWTGDESELMTGVEHIPTEFWGMCSTVSTEVQHCPDCGSEEVFEAQDDD